MLHRNKRLVITFYTSSMAFATEKACKTENIDGELISAPRNLSSDCGISYATKPENEEKMKEILEKYKIEFDRIVEE